MLLFSWTLHSRMRNGNYQKTWSGSSAQLVRFWCVQITVKLNVLCKFTIFNIPDPNDTDNRPIAPYKLNNSPQTPTVQPNEEDLSFLLSSMQVSENKSIIFPCDSILFSIVKFNFVQVTRGRSFSTVMQPKVESVGTKSVTGQSSNSSRSQGRKKSTPSFSKSEKGYAVHTFY